MKIRTDIEPPFLCQKAKAKKQQKSQLSLGE